MCIIANTGESLLKISAESIIVSSCNPAAQHDIVAFIRAAYECYNVILR